MESKLGTSTSSDVSAASQQHYAAENQIMEHVRGMTLAGKKKLASQMEVHCKNAEQMA